KETLPPNSRWKKSGKSKELKILNRNFLIQNKMNAADLTLVKEYQNVIRLKEILIADINMDIERNKENIRFEKRKKIMNEERLEFEEKTLESIKKRLEEIEEQE
ncbi:hypothetical protein, partial [Kaistella sp.]|uniref:hypothetical protein n=1 Tax=Kaistella sp. TaxID=2782235 RepID=UPI002F955E07